MRLTGKHETAPWNKFSYGIADRGASIRVPHSFANNGYKGYLEDRRPNSQGDPYQIASQILKTIASVPTQARSAPQRKQVMASAFAILEVDVAGEALRGASPLLFREPRSG